MTVLIFFIAGLLYLLALRARVSITWELIASRGDRHSHPIWFRQLTARKRPLPTMCPWSSLPPNDFSDTCFEIGIGYRIPVLDRTHMRLCQGVQSLRRNRIFIRNPPKKASSNRVLLSRDNSARREMWAQHRL